MQPDEVRDLRGDMTRAAFAEIIGVTPLTVYRWELPTDEKESRRPQRRFRRALKEFRDEQFSAPEPVNNGASQRPNGTDSALEITPTERALLGPIFEQILNAQWRAAENALMSAFSSGRLSTEGANVLAQTASGMLKMLWRNDVRGTYSSFGPILRQLEDLDLGAEVMVPAHTLAAMLFASPDGRVFNPGRVNRHVALAEQKMEDGSEFLEFRALLRSAEMWAAYHLDDAGLHDRLRIRSHETFKRATTPVARWVSWEVGTIAAYLGGCVVEASRFFEELVEEAKKADLPVIASRATGFLALMKLFGNEPLESVADLVEDAQALILRERIEPGFAGLLLSAANAEILCRRGRFEEALGSIEAAVEDARALQWPPIELFFTHMRLNFFVEDRDIDSLVNEYASFEGGHRQSLIRAIHHVSAGVAAINRFDGVTASTEFEQAGAIARDAGTNPQIEIFCQSVSYYSAVTSKNRGLADSALRRVEQSLERIPLVWMSHSVKLYKALDAALRGHFTEAAQLSEAAQSAFAKVEDQAQLLMANRLRAIIASVLEEPDYETRLEETAHRFEEMGIPIPPIYRREAIDDLKGSRKNRRSKECEVIGLNSVAIPLDRLAVHGLSQAQILAELADVLRRFAGKESPVWIDELGSSESVLEIHRLGEGTPEEFVEFGDGCGRRFRVGVAGPLNNEERTALSLFTQVTSLSMEVASLRTLTNPAGSSIESEAPELPGFVAVSDSSQELVREIARLANSRANVLIRGESGAGKEVVAHAVHQLSSRAHKPFVTFNCAAVPRDLFEGQLFGYKKGAFTGAQSDHPGVIRAADGGTLFLDEIGDLPLDVQPKLLRFLENGEVFPLGETRAAHVDVRVVAATHQDLQSMVKERMFREDLYYRLAVVPLEILPLRERREDILALAQHFIKTYSPDADSRPRLAPDVAPKLMEHDWPGNVRELRNVIERSLAYTPLPRVLSADDLRL